MGKMPTRPQDPQWEWPPGREPEDNCRGVKGGYCLRTVSQCTASGRKLNPHLFTKAEWDRTSVWVIWRTFSDKLTEISEKGDLFAGVWVLTPSWWLYAWGLFQVTPLKGVQCPFCFKEERNWRGPRDLPGGDHSLTVNDGKGIQTQAARPFMEFTSLVTTLQSKSWVSSSLWSSSLPFSLTQGPAQMNGFFLSIRGHI